MFHRLRTAEWVRMLALMRSRKWSYAIGIVGDSATAAAFPILLAFVIKWMFDAAIHGDPSLLYRSIVVLLIAMLFSGIFSPLFSYMYHKSVKYIIVELGERLHNHLQKLPVRFFERTHSGDILSRMTMMFERWKKCMLNWSVHLLLL